MIVSDETTTTPPDIQQLLEQGLSHFLAGRLSEAEDIYRQILAIEPQQPDALHLLGTVAFRAGNTKAAIDLIGRAISVKPTAAEYWGNISSILNAENRYEQAGVAASQAIRVRPEYAEAYYHLGNALVGRHEGDKAALAYAEAIRLRPDFVEALIGMGNLLLTQSRPSEAVGFYRQAIARRPGFADAHTNLAAALQSAGQLHEAITENQLAIQLKPDAADAYSNLGTLYLTTGDIEAAITSCKKAIELRPQEPAGYNNLGQALQAKGLPDDATAAYLKALSVRHNNPKAWNNLGGVQFSQGMLDEAIASFDHAAQLSTTESTAHSNKVYALHFHPHYDADAIARELRVWDERRARPLLPASRSYPNDRDPGRKLRIGYVSPDFRHHVVGFNVLPLIERHDRSRFEVFCYSNVSEPDDMTRTFQAKADQWRNIVGVNDEAAAEQIRIDRVDILVDLALHLAGGRLLVFARKPAPVQVTFAGYPGSTGMQAMDYRLTDPHLEPPVSGDTRYAEQSIVLPDSFWCYAPTGPSPDVNELPAVRYGFVTFGCLSNFSKINGEVLEKWAAVMLRVPRSRLILLAAVGSHRRRLLDAMAALGVSEDRITFVDRRPRADYLALYQQIDLSLDTFPYNGHTTNLDSLWMGVPFVTLVGQTPVSRAGWSQLSNLEMTELAALSDKQFVDIAVNLAGDISRLAELRKTLHDRLRASPIMDAASFTRNIETAYRQMWKAWVMA